MHAEANEEKEELVAVYETNIVGYGHSPHCAISKSQAFAYMQAIQGIGYARVPRHSGNETQLQQTPQVQPEKVFILH